MPSSAVFANSLQKEPIRVRAISTRNQIPSLMEAPFCINPVSLGGMGEGEEVAEGRRRGLGVSLTTGGVGVRRRQVDDLEEERRSTLGGGVVAGSGG